MAAPGQRAQKPSVFAVSERLCHSCQAFAGRASAAQDEGFREMGELVAFYKKNAEILRRAFTELGFSVYGGTNAPYVWVGFPGQARPSVPPGAVSTRKPAGGSAAPWRLVTRKQCHGLKKAHCSALL